MAAISFERDLSMNKTDLEQLKDAKPTEKFYKAVSSQNAKMFESKKSNGSVHRSWMTLK